MPNSAEVIQRTVALFVHLRKKDASEIALVSGRLPCVKVGGSYEPLDDQSLSTDEIYLVLRALGGSSHVETLSDKPTTWRTDVAGVGAVLVGVVLRGDKLQARVLLDGPKPTSVESEQGPLSTALGGALGGAPREVAAAMASVRPAPAPVDAQSEIAALLAQAMPVPMRERTETGSKRPASMEIDLAPRSQRGEVNLGAARPSRAPNVSSAPGARPDHALSQALGVARKCRASDVHVVAGRPLLVRLAQQLTPQGPVLSAEAVRAMLMPIIPDRCRAQFEEDGACDFSLATETEGRFRVNVARHRTGLKGSFRLISAEIPTLASLGLPEAIAHVTSHHQGLIVATGPTGHGKTTTVAALVNLINTDTAHHVITVEDPIEFIHPRKRALLSQREVGSHTRSFQSALKASLREDPEVIVVGELRDAETVRMALSAAETGHLVLGTMNTPSAAKTIERLIDLFPTGDQPQVRLTLATALRMILSQRLVPARDGNGLVVAVEILPGSFALGALIRDNKTYQIPSLQQRGKSLGIVRLDDSLVELVQKGAISLEAALAVAESPGDFAAKAGQPPGTR